MAHFSAIPLEEARVSALPPRRQTQEVYRGYIRSVGTEPETAGRLQLDEGDRPITERARLKSAAKAEGVGLSIQRRGMDIFFWQREDDPEPTPGRMSGNAGANRMGNKANKGGRKAS